MKAITIDHYGEEADYILLEDIEDVIAYGEYHIGDVEIAAATIIKSNLPNDRLDHLYGSNGRISGMISGAVMKSKIKGGVPIFELGQMADERILRLLKWSAAGEQIMLNHNGGFCFLNEDTVILREKPYEFTREDTHKIKPNTTYINLENDQELEQHTIDYLSKKDPNYSYVCGLRNYSKPELTDVFKKFKKNGGSIAYIYTTGMDVPQIEEYCAALKAAEITNIHFEFNAGVGSDLQETLDRLAEDDALTVVIL